MKQTIFFTQKNKKEAKDKGRREIRQQATGNRQASQKGAKGRKGGRAKGNLAAGSKQQATGRQATRRKVQENARYLFLSHFRTFALSPFNPVPARPDSAKIITVNHYFLPFHGKIYLTDRIFSTGIPLKSTLFGGLRKKIHNECNFFLTQ
jgi:hypothetical protein